MNDDERQRLLNAHAAAVALDPDSVERIDVRFKDMIYREISAIDLAQDKITITFSFADGHTVHFRVEGECCSHSWIEHLEVPVETIGATILWVRDGAPITSNHPQHDDENGGDSIQVYNTVFATDRGDIVLEYRNSSNGYYGGELVRVGSP